MTEAPALLLVLREELILIFYLAQSLQNSLGTSFDVYILIYNQCENDQWNSFPALLCTAGLWNRMYTRHNTSQFGWATRQVLSIRLRLLVAVLDSTALSQLQVCRKFRKQRNMDATPRWCNQQTPDTPGFPRNYRKATQLFLKKYIIKGNIMEREAIIAFKAETEVHRTNIYRHQMGKWEAGWIGRLALTYIHCYVRDR